MNKSTKLWLITAAFLVIMGGVIFVGIMSSLNWDFTKFTTAKFETNTYEVGEKFSSISIDTYTADILFAVSDDNNCKVVCYEQKNIKHSVHVQDGTLTVKTVDERKWYEYIGINFRSPKITVYLPEAEYALVSIKDRTGDIKIPKEFKFDSADISLTTGDVKFYSSVSKTIKIKASTGDILIEQISSGSLELFATTGDITVSDVTCRDNINIKVTTGDVDVIDTICKNLTSKGSTGNISLNNVIAKENFSVERGTGDVKFDSCDAAEIFVDTDTGDVKGSLLADKVFITETNTGSVDVPKTVIGGRCEISTDTGDIKIVISNYITNAM